MRTALPLYGDKPAHLLHTCRGEPVTISKAICMHEEDTGLLYKHVD